MFEEFDTNALCYVCLFLELYRKQFYNFDDMFCAILHELKDRSVI